MAQANQVAVAGPSALADAPRPAQNAMRQVPHFLLKLYEMLNDPANDEMIRWSDEGDSFYVVREERFAREVLGHWFKHQNFSSFVRQLNLYGFRRVTHLQQGILRMGHESQSNHFGHPYFRRGQPDLLCLIQRKRPPPSLSRAEEASLRSQDVKNPQAVDVRSIVDGISAIRRQQQAIAADLSALKQSNDALWKEAIEARQRHAKHEDTINRILKFLAGLFGRVMQVHLRDQLSGDSRPPTKRRRLLIGDGRPNHEGAQSPGGDFNALGDIKGGEQSPLPTASERFATVETSGPPIASVASPENTPLATEDSSHSPAQPDSLRSGGLNQTTHTNNGFPAEVPPSSTRALGTLSTTVPLQEQKPNAPSPDVLWRTTFQKMLSSPAQYQPIMQAFADTHQPYSMVTPNPAPGFGQQTSPVYVSSASPHPPYGGGGGPVNIPQSQLATWDPSWTTQASAGQVPWQPTSATPAPTPLEGALLDNDKRVQKAYRDAAEIHADIDTLQSNIHSLIRDMGLDPQNPNFPTVPVPPVPPIPPARPAVPGPPVPTPTPAALSALAASASSSSAVDGGIPGVNAGLGTTLDDFPFEAWLDQLSSSSAVTDFTDLTYPDLSGGAAPGTGMNGEHNDELDDDFSAFLNLPNSDPAVTMAQSVPSPAGHKRKLDATEDVLDGLGDSGETPSSKK
ncbi:hypothetical protein C8Q79DRAFT_1009523 [Trametes meyenii]|nr:hypothetical protein C8Q79DRAFT_1009523 [Trametes meyenii]